MPFGMGPMGWFMWPYIVQWMQYWHLGYGLPYSGYAGYGAKYPAYMVPNTYPQMTKEREISILQDQASVLQQELDRINSRLGELQETK